jgi:WD40 repeat protein/serine/threonine protein kinase
MTSRLVESTNGLDCGTSEQSELARMLDGYLAAIEAGKVVDPETIAAAHPLVADRFRACLAVLRVASQVEGRAAADADAAIEPAIETRVGDFQIQRLIGRGGMGIVFEAEQVPLHRRVALKVLPFAAALDPQQLRRFQIEAQAAAQLHHTNIVPIFSVGCERGVHYYAMQFIEGQTVAQLIGDLRRLAGLGGQPADAAVPAHAVIWGIAADRFIPRSTRTGTSSGIREPAYFRTVAELGLQIAEGLDYAHRLGIIHRDIKPANLLVDIRGNPWITDFGLARMQADSGLTMTGDVVGTLRYISPEQSAPRRGIVDHRTDVYSLGATLYELVTLRPAHDAHGRADLSHQMDSDEPVPPRHWNAGIPRDLETIVFKALARDVEQRYGSARDLAEDLRRFLDRRPIHARRPSLWKRAEKWGRRHKTLIASGTVLLAVVAIALAIVRVQARTNRALERITRHERYARDIRDAFHHAQHSEFRSAMEVLTRWLPVAGQDDERSFPWYYLRRLGRFQPRRKIGLPGDVYHIQFSPRGDLLASAGKDGHLRLWETREWKPIADIAAHPTEANVAAFSPDGQTLASSGDDGVVKVWNLATRECAFSVAAHPGVQGVVLFSRDGRFLVVVSMDGKGLLLDARTGTEKERFLLPPGTYLNMALSPDGTTLAVVGDDRALLWSLSEHSVTRSLEGIAGRLQGVAFSHDGNTLAVGNEALGTISLFEVAGGRLVQGHRSRHQGVFSLAFAPGDRMLASAHGDGTVRIWDVHTAGVISAARAHPGRVWCLTYSGDGRTLASGGELGTINLEDCWTEREKVVISVHGKTVSSVVFAPDSQQATLFAFGGRDGMIINVDLVEGTQRESRKIREANTIFNGVLSPDRKCLATEVDFDTITVWNLEEGRPEQTIPFPRLRYGGPDAGPRSFGDLAFSPDGRHIAVNNISPEIFLLDLRGRVERRFREQFARFKFLPDGAAAILYNQNGVVRVNLKTWGSLSAKSWVHSALETLALSNDGRMIATAGREGAIQLWDAARLQSKGTLLGHHNPVTGLAIAPDHKVVASQSAGDGTVRLWDIATLQELGAIDDEIDYPVTLSFSPDGKTLIGYGPDYRCQITLWRTSRE